jgi:hypothetical protein
MSNSSPRWRYAHYWTEFFFEGSRYAGRCDHFHAASYFHSEAGARAAARIDEQHGGGGDYDRFSRIEKLIDGRWRDDWHPRPQPAALADNWDEVPF